MGSLASLVSSELLETVVGDRIKLRICLSKNLRGKIKSSVLIFKYPRWQENHVQTNRRNVMINAVKILQNWLGP